MESLQELYRIGFGPSSSHTMGPVFAAERYLKAYPAARRIRITLYGSLAATGKGHFTDKVLQERFRDRDLELSWKPDELLPGHPNGMRFEVLKPQDLTADSRVDAYSVGGGAILMGDSDVDTKVYAENTLEEIIQWCESHGETLPGYVRSVEPKVFDHLETVWSAMQRCIRKGLEAEGALPGVLCVPRKAAQVLEQSREGHRTEWGLGRLMAYTLAVSEQNAAACEVVTAPTCGAAGVVPGLLYYMRETRELSEAKVLNALAVAGVIGNLIKCNASISGAEVGCQGEVGTACSMAAAAAVYLMGGSLHQTEYAAEMALEHHLGLTCDPVAGLVQIPCIERNALASSRALDCANYAMLSDGRHKISFDTVVKTMAQTGADLISHYKETGKGGLAVMYRYGS